MHKTYSTLAILDIQDEEAMLDRPFINAPETDEQRELAALAVQGYTAYAFDEVGFIRALKADGERWPG